MNTQPRGTQAAVPTRLWNDAHHSDADPGRGERIVG